MTTGAELKQKFDNNWGSWRRFIAANPLTGFWTGVGVGALIVAFFVWVL